MKTIFIMVASPEQTWNLLRRGSVISGPVVAIAEQLRGSYLGKIPACIDLEESWIFPFAENSTFHWIMW
jgi:hypothetical protein